MAPESWRAPLARYGAPIAFLVAVTVVVLLVRAGLDSGSSAPSSTGTTRTTLTETTAQPGRKQYYRIRQGDTLGGVADRFDTTVAVLLALNPDVRPNSLTIGQRLRVR
jgi:LysM repeat protein